MTRRTVIGVVAVVGVVAANGAVWYARSGTGPSPPDPRDARRRQLTDKWRDLEATPLESAAEALAAVVDGPEPVASGRNAQGFGKPFSFESFSAEARGDLREAIAGAVTAIGSRESGPMVQYMRDRGLRLDPAKVDRMKEFLPEGAAIDPKSRPAEQYGTIHEALAVDPHWESIIAEATHVNVWRPASLRHVSMIQLGRNESWVFGNEVVFGGVFSAKPDYFSASRDKPAPLADVRVVVDHTEQHGAGRSPYFFRFWYAETDKTWRPMALKLVRTGDPELRAPVILF